MVEAGGAVETLVADFGSRLRNSGDPLQEMLAQQIVGVQRLLVQNGERLSGLIAKRNEALDECQVEVADLRFENDMYRSKLINAGLLVADPCETGGTGDNACSSVQRTWMGQESLSSLPASSSHDAPSSSVQQTPVSAILPTNAEEPQDLPNDLEPERPETVRPMPPPEADLDLPGAVFSPATNVNRTPDPPRSEPEPVHVAPTAFTGVVPAVGPKTTDDGLAERRGTGWHEGETHNRASVSGGHTGGQRQKAVFADAGAMKAKLKETLTRREYNVHDFYYEEGIAQAIGRHFIFENATLLVIAMNAIWIAVDTDYNNAINILDAEWPFFVAELFFAIYFSFEWGTRFLAFKHKRNCFRDAWFVFDTFMVAMMVGETWVLNIVMKLTAGGGDSSSAMGDTSILRMLRLLRLSRMARMVRLLRVMPELMIMIKAMKSAMRSVFFALALLIGIVYVFSISFVSLCDDTEAGRTHFSTVGRGMMTLILDTTLPDQKDLVYEVGDAVDGFYGILNYFLILMFFLISAITVTNMLIGILCEVVSVISNVEKEGMLINFVKQELQSMMDNFGLDADGDNRISQEEFSQLLNQPAAARVLQDVGVDVVGLVDFTDFIFEKGEDIGFADFLDLVLQLRGSNTATVKDVIDLGKRQNVEIGKVIDRLETALQAWEPSLREVEPRRPSGQDEWC